MEKSEELHRNALKALREYLDFLLDEAPKKDFNNGVLYMFSNMIEVLTTSISSITKARFEEDLDDRKFFSWREFS